MADQRSGFHAKSGCHPRPSSFVRTVQARDIVAAGIPGRRIARRETLHRRFVNRVARRIRIARRPSGWLASRSPERAKAGGAEVRQPLFYRHEKPQSFYDQVITDPDPDPLMSAFDSLRTYSNSAFDKPRRSVRLPPRANLMVSLGWQKGNLIVPRDASVLFPNRLARD